MKRARMLILLLMSSMLFLGGCTVFVRDNTPKVDETKLTEEYKQFCKTQANEGLCRFVMSDTERFESDINAKFKERFNVDSFKLVGIDFDYGISPGGFSATFIRSIEPMVTFSGHFDYDEKNGFDIRESTDVDKLPGEDVLITSFLIYYYGMRFPLEEIENEIRDTGVLPGRESVSYQSWYTRFYGDSQYLSLSYNSYPDSGGAGYALDTFRNELLEKIKVGDFESIKRNDRYYSNEDFNRLHLYVTVYSDQDNQRKLIDIYEKVYDILNNEKYQKYRSVFFNEIGNLNFQIYVNNYYNIYKVYKKGEKYVVQQFQIK